VDAFGLRLAKTAITAPVGPNGIPRSSSVASPAAAPPCKPISSATPPAPPVHTTGPVFRAAPAPLVANQQQRRPGSP